MGYVSMIALEKNQSRKDLNQKFLLITDPALVQGGLLEVSNVHDMWITESSLPNGGIGVPEISYCSPLTRCLVTNSITFSKQLEAESIDTIVVEVFLFFLHFDNSESFK